MGWQDTILKNARSSAEWAGKFISTNGHAQQNIPAQHRLLSAGGMFIGWLACDQLRDIIFGVNQTSEGEFVEIKRDDVPEPLRFLHKAIDWNPNSDAPSDQWKKLAHQMMPAFGAGIGTMAGSLSAFQLNGRAHNFSVYKDPKNPISLMQADGAAQYAQSKPFRILTALTGGAAGSSMLVYLYGAFLNLAFATANGAKIFTGDIAKGSSGPAKALAERIEKFPAYIKTAFNENREIDKDWSEIFVTRVLEPLFGNELKTKEAQEAARIKVHDTVQNIVNEHMKLGLPQEETIEKIAKMVKETVGDASPTVAKDGTIIRSGFDTFLHEFGLRPENANIGNAIPFAREFHEFLVKLGIGKETSVKSLAARVGQKNIHIPSQYHNDTVGVGI
jgi:hypothetical protein